MISVLPSHHYGAQLSWKWLNTCLLMENNEQIPCFAVLTCVACALSIKLSLSELMSLLISILLVLFAIPERATERLCQTQLLSGIKPQQPTVQKPALCYCQVLSSLYHLNALEKGIITICIAIVHQVNRADQSPVIAHIHFPSHSPSVNNKDDPFLRQDVCKGVCLRKTASLPTSLIVMQNNFIQYQIQNGSRSDCLVLPYDYLSNARHRGTEMVNKYYMQYFFFSYFKVHDRQRVSLQMTKKTELPNS